MCEASLGVIAILKVRKMTLYNIINCIINTEKKNNIWYLNK